MLVEVSYDDERCPNGRQDCAGHGTIDENHYFRCPPCHKDLRQKAMKEGIVKPFYVVATNIERCYGGPEEGGWYYDWTTILEVRKVWDWKTGLKAMRELIEKYPQPRYNRFSVLGREGDYEIHMYYDVDQFPRESTERPRYE